MNSRDYTTITDTLVALARNTTCTRLTDRGTDAYCNPVTGGCGAITYGITMSRGTRLGSYPCFHCNHTGLSRLTHAEYRHTLNTLPDTLAFIYEAATSAYRVRCDLFRWDGPAWSSSDSPATRILAGIEREHTNTTRRLNAQAALPAAMRDLTAAARYAAAARLNNTNPDTDLLWAKTVNLMTRHTDPTYYPNHDWTPTPVPVPA